MPFYEWFNKLDKSVRTNILKRLDRLEEGNYGDCKRIDADVYELRFTIGAGYRVYFTEKDDVIVMLLLGGDKSTQSNDIAKAKEYAQKSKGKI